MNETKFIKDALGNSSSIWDKSLLSALAGLHVPDSLLGRRHSLFRADINEQWARWFVEGIADPHCYTGANFSYARLFKDVLTEVEKRFKIATFSESKELAAITARILRDKIILFQADRKRKTISSTEKTLLIELSGSPPRCWICGMAFSKEAIDNFIFRERHKVPLPEFIDILKPRGLKERDLSVEIDHVVPYSHGGKNEGNLQLACGWCNRYKSNFASIYDVDGRPRLAGPNNFGIRSLPQPFWTVRLLAVERKCEYSKGCSISANSDAVTVAPFVSTGAMNPSNLHVTCYPHDPLRDIRLQPKEVILKLWGVKESACSY